MAMTTKFDGSTDKTIKLGGDGNPKSIEGYFMGSKDTKSDFGPGKLHLFQTTEGVVGVWGKTRMNSLLTSEHVGQMVIVSFTGMIKPSKPGRRPSYGYQLQYDKENTIDMGGVNLNAAHPAADTEDDAEEMEEYSSNEATEEEYETPAPVRATAPKVPMVAPSATRQAQIQAMLNKGKTKTI